MKGFIEVTSRIDNEKFLIAISCIEQVSFFSKDDFTSIFVYPSNKRKKAAYYAVVETYDEVKQKISEAS
ncbi:MAG: hypothetical protein FWC80_00870 [Firmicutes bacterium]|nr:hypothetical protein [Bacillota bacterium]